jgi:SAM-dependent methyltransferase
VSARPRRGTGAHATAPWWATHFDGRYLREYEPLFTEARARREVARLLALLAELPQDARVLDCPCGQGRHARLLAEAGYRVTGLDYSRELLAEAKAASDLPVRALRYVRGDMRALPARWDGRFDAVLNLFTSFGFFDDAADDRRTLASFARVLRPGGLLVWHGGHRDGVLARFLTRDWWQGEDGTLYGQERAFDPLSGRLHVRSTWHGPDGAGEREHAIRLYSATHLAELLEAAGFTIEWAGDGWHDRPLHRRSTDMLLVARRAD